VAGRTGSTKRRQRSIEEVEWVRLTLATIGGLYSDAVETQSWNTYVFLDDLLTDGSTPTEWIRNGVATWIQGLRAGADVARGICSALSEPLGPSDRQSGIYGDQVEFYVDGFTEATDPIETDIPSDQINFVQLRDNNGIPEDCVNLTLSSDDKVLVALYDLTISKRPLEDREPKLRPGSYTATLTWANGGSKTIAVNVAKTAP
jgi:hypothetical protein